MRITLACPTSLDHQEINKQTAPIWVDAVGNEYYVASGILPAQIDNNGNIIDWVDTNPVTANPTQITVVTQLDGLAALALMGLTVKNAE